MIEKGDRIELVHTSDVMTNLRQGDRGTVTIIDAMDTVHVRWDNGSTLGMVPGEDSFKLVKETKLILDDENTDEPLTRG
jgi:hypothetical protein